MLLAGFAPGILKRNPHNAPVWTIYEEVAPKLMSSGVVMKQEQSKSTIAEQQETEARKPRTRCMFGGSC